jgi:TRAP-type C4-dicarboxylate transport system permease small subunit
MSNSTLGRGFSRLHHAARCIQKKWPWICRKNLTIIALCCGFTGASFGFLAARRVGSRFSRDGVALGYPPEYTSWFWENCGTIGFFLIALAFLLQLIANVLFQDQDATADSQIGLPDRPESKDL